MDNTKRIEGLLLPEEINIADRTLKRALELGASSARLSLSKSVSDIFGTLNGQLDKVSHCLDRAIVIALFVDGKYGSFSINRLDENSLEDFLKKAIDTVKMLAEDKFRTLPKISRKATDAISGKELDTFDDTYGEITSELRLQQVLAASIFNRTDNLPKGVKLISEEGEYSDSVSDFLLIDSDGLRCRQMDTSFEYSVEATIEDGKGNKYSGFKWQASPKFSPNILNCGERAVFNAIEQINPKSCKGGKNNIIIQNDVATKVVLPILNALNATGLDQKNSFLLDSLGKKIFGEGLTIIDKSREKGVFGSRLFDYEGVSTKETVIIDKGIVHQYFVNTYMANKTGLSPTVDDFSRPTVMPYVPKEYSGDIGVEDLMEICGNGILITGFNGGNSNSSTGNFSYGIKGFVFENGKKSYPVKEMLMTGDFITLWNNLIAAGNDVRKDISAQIPSLAFKDVEISA